jgi:endonuclease/exonuclease/phosphatase family metal-dependent hydrolase
MLKNFSVLLAILSFALVKPSLTSGEDLADQPVRIVSYNIRHGEGSDSKLDLERTAEVITRLAPDIVGLQEVDDRVGRTKNVNQPQRLAELTGMNASFGSFMALQGGEYGLAVLSKFPIKSSRSIRLPRGNEPRVALAVEVQLPSGESLMVVNVHFDWVNDDGYRFEQAKVVAEYLKTLKLPYVLLGDFNDVRESRTLALFAEVAKEAKKPEGDRFTFSATRPHQEIDFVFLAPGDRWGVGEVRVIDEPVASDHRPVSVIGRLTAPRGE